MGTAVLHGIDRRKRWASQLKSGPSLPQLVKGAEQQSSPAIHVQPYLSTCAWALGVRALRLASDPPRWNLDSLGLFGLWGAPPWPSGPAP